MAQCNVKLLHIFQNARKGMPEVLHLLRRNGKTHKLVLYTGAKKQNNTHLLAHCPSPCQLTFVNLGGGAYEGPLRVGVYLFWCSRAYSTIAHCTFNGRFDWKVNKVLTVLVK